MLLQELVSFDQPHTEEYWLSLAKVSTQLGQDSHAQAYEKALALRPDDAEILENLNGWRYAMTTKKQATACRYGWDRLRRIEDVQRLMRFSWKRENWLELDQWLSLADEMQSAKPLLLSHTGLLVLPCNAQNGEWGPRRGEHALRQVLRLRGPDPEITEAMVWLLLSGKKIDHASLDVLLAFP